MDTISWDSVAWMDGDETMDAVCPACANAAPKPVRLKIRSPWPPNPVQSLVVCPHCGTASYPTLTQPPYEAVFDPLVTCYLEQNAGIDSMARVIAAVDPARVRRYLELGCGYGLLLDYTRTMFGWQVRGFDPGFSAQEGRQTLGVDISHTYLTTPADAGPEPHDLVFCSEVIEHVFDPLSLLELLRQVLAPDGTLMLTTPSAGAIHAGTQPGTLLSLLSPGYHVVLFSKQGMETILRRAGFADIMVVDEGHALRAAASPGRLSTDFNRPYDRRLYRGYLEQRIPTIDPATPLGLGYRYRLLKETTHSGDYAAARSAAAATAEAVQARWPDMPVSDPVRMLEHLAAAPLPTGVEDYEAAYPFNLCGVLYFHGMLAWQLDARHERAAQWFQAAALAGERMRKALHVIGADDGETEELGWLARANAAHMGVWSDRPEQAAEDALRLGTTPSPILGETMPAAVCAKAQRTVFVDLVNRGAYAAADRLAAAVEAAPPAAEPAPAVLAFAFGLLDLDHRNAPAAAAGRFAEARRAAADEDATGDGALPWKALAAQARALAKAGDADAARACLDELLAAPTLGTLLLAAPQAVVAGISALVDLDAVAARAAFDAVLAHAGTTAAMRDHLRLELLTLLVNKGLYAQADPLAGEVEKALPKAMPDLAKASYLLGILNLTHRNAPKTAARWFRQGYEAGRLAWLDTPPVDTGLLWVSLYHQALALTKAKNDKAAASVVKEFLDGMADPALPRPDPAIVDSVKKLL